MAEAAGKDFLYDLKQPSTVQQTPLFWLTTVSALVCMSAVSVFESADYIARPQNSRVSKTLLTDSSIPGILKVESTL